VEAKAPLMMRRSVANSHPRQPINQHLSEEINPTAKKITERCSIP
jgi:hypothetical protein